MKNQIENNSSIRVGLFLGILIIFNSIPLFGQYNIFIDPGHSDADILSKFRTELEVQTNLAVSLKLRDKLLADSTKPWQVQLSRVDGEGNDPTGVTARADMANSWGADRLISIHCNAHDDKNVTGTETFWCDVDRNKNLNPNRNIDEDLARKIQTAMVQQGNWRGRRVVEDFTYLTDNGVPYHLGILREASAPGALNEIGFVTNVTDAAKLSVDSWRNIFASAYLSAIKEHYRDTLPKTAEPTSVDYFSSTIPERYFLSQNYPNPFNPTTTINYQISNVGTQNFVSLRVYDVLGREIATLVNEQKPVGSYTRTWNASGMPSGVYFYRLTSGSYTETKKLVLLK